MYSETEIDIKELEKLFAEPNKKSEINEEWLASCVTRIGNWDSEQKKKCPNPAVVNIILVCPFCGSGKSGKCENHAVKAMAGQLYCSECSIKAKAYIYMKPLSAIWKTDD